MTLETLEILSKFTFIPNLKGLCGKEDSAQVLRQCIDKQDFQRAKKEFRKFPTLSAHLQTIGEIFEIDPFSPEVVETYLFGSSLLQKIKPEHFFLLWDNLKKYGALHHKAVLPVKTPKFFIPTHNFYTSTNIPSTYDLCGVHLGEVDGRATALHYKQIIKFLTPEEKNNLSYWTKKVLDSHQPTPGVC